ncbi:MAG: hypothetical protein JNK87_41695, partial [Bryobacterales bacterium]|nr:hypothetical protein [Bryobacterales bacterium]
MILLAAFSSMLGQPVTAPYEADVVVIVDTSTSMTDDGMDPERTSLLVTKLFSDIVPGRLVVIRLLDLVDDSSLIPSVRTERTENCTERPGMPCRIVDVPASSYEKVRRERAGSEVRPQRGDSAFKKRLEGHLEQRSNNSLFHAAFLAAQGAFEDGKPGVPRYLIWLSDGAVDQGLEAPTAAALEGLRRMGADVRAIVFGRGSTKF